MCASWYGAPSALRTASAFVVQFDLLIHAIQISLDPPIRQGGTRYPHLVLQFDKAAKIDLQMALKEMEGKLPKESRLEEEMSGKVYKVFRRVVRELTQKKITVPGTYLRYLAARHTRHAT